MGTIGAWLKHAWNAFTSPRIESRTQTYDGGYSFSNRADRIRPSYTNERSIIASIYTRLSVDASALDIRHVRLDENDRYLEDINSGLQECLTVEANVDQGARHFRQDVFSSMFSKGCIVVVPVDTTLDPTVSGGFDIKNMRIGEVVSWMPYHVRVAVYNEKTGMREQVVLEKRFVAIVENPFYDVMNEPSSTLQRLTAKLNMLDAVDKQSASGKIDMIIQLPYVIKSEARRATAMQRRADIEAQLSGSQYGIAYTDGAEKITQLNRPLENNLFDQVKYLIDLLYTQLGLTPEVMNGTADEAAMLNYYNRTIEPVVTAFVEAMKRSFLTKTARSQKQSIMAFRSPFKFVPMEQIAEIADKFTRNEIASSNDIRQEIGWKPSRDPKADELRNSNMPQPDQAAAPGADPASAPGAEDPMVQSALDDLNQQLDDMLSEFGVSAGAPA